MFKGMYTAWNLPKPSDSENNEQAITVLAKLKSLYIKLYDLLLQML